MRQNLTVEKLQEHVVMTARSAVVALFTAKNVVGSEIIAPIISLTGEPDELVEALKRTRGQASWVRVWREIAGRHEDAAQDLGTGRAGRIRHIRLASCALSFANIGHSDPGLYLAVNEELTSTHTLLHELVHPNYERVAIKLSEGAAPALLRVPQSHHSVVHNEALAPEDRSGAAGSDQSFPVLVILQGLERSKELDFQIEAALLAHGFACLSVDQPGVGEALAHGVTLDSPARLDEFADGIRNLVEADPRLNANKLVLYGHSFGGGMALAICDAVGATAIATLAAPFDIDPRRMPVAMRRRIRFALSVETMHEAHELFVSVGMVARVGKINVPHLIMHGRNDSLIDVSNAYKIAQHTGQADVRIFPFGDHSCTAYSSAIYPLLAEWARDHVDSDPPLR